MCANVYTFVVSKSFLLPCFFNGCMVVSILNMNVRKKNLNIIYLRNDHEIDVGKFRKKNINYMKLEMDPYIWI